MQNAIMFAWFFVINNYVKICIVLNTLWIYVYYNSYFVIEMLLTDTQIYGIELLCDFVVVRVNQSMYYIKKKQLLEIMYLNYTFITCAKIV